MHIKDMIYIYMCHYYEVVNCEPSWPEVDRAYLVVYLSFLSGSPSAFYLLDKSTHIALFTYNSTCKTYCVST